MPRNVPPELEDKFRSCKEQVMEKGESEESAYGICYVSVVEGKALDDVMREFILDPAPFKAMGAEMNKNKVDIDSMSESDMRSTLSKMRDKSPKAKEMMGDKMPADMDESEMRAMMKRMMADEEMKPMMMGMMGEMGKSTSLEAIEGELKVGARNNRSDQERLQQIHDYAVENGAKCPGKEEMESETEPTMGMRSISPDDVLVGAGSEVKALDDMGRIGGYGVRFSTEEMPDLVGDYFTPDTYYGKHAGDGAEAMIHHGHPMGQEPIFQKMADLTLAPVKAAKDDKGIFVETVCNLADEYEKMIYELVRSKKLRWSSGTASHAMRKEANGKITRWPIVEFSLTPLAAEPSNTITPLKSLSIPAISLPTGEAQADGESAQSDGTANAASETNGTKPVPPASGFGKPKPNSSKERKTMEITPEIQELLDATVDQAIKKVVATLPATNNGGTNVQVTHDPADNPFTSIAEECRAVKSVTLSNGRQMDDRLKRLDATKATGASEAQAVDGGYLLEPTFTAEVLKPLHEEGPFTRAVRKLPVGTNSNYGYLNGVDETSRAAGSRWGGIRGYRLAEGGTPTASRPKFRRINWELKKYAVLCYATDELLADAAQFSTVVREGASEELSFMANDDILNGDGLAGPFGILTASALVSVSKETGQAAATIVNENLLKMWARMHSRSKRNAVWYINTDTYPQLHALSLTAGVSALEPRFVTYAQDGSLRIFGKPVLETEFNATLGTVGDIVLADMNEYLYWEKGGEQAASSIHVQFLTDETVFRFIYRCDGQVSIASALTPYKGTGNTVSPFVALATRA